MTVVPTFVVPEELVALVAKSVHGSVKAVVADEDWARNRAGRIEWAVAVTSMLLGESHLVIDYDSDDLRGRSGIGRFPDDRIMAANTVA